jgi:hypothetical protein
MCKRTVAVRRDLESPVQVDVPDGYARSQSGSIHFFGGATFELTDDELGHIASKHQELFKKLLIAPKASNERKETKALPQPELVAVKEGATSQLLDDASPKKKPPR